jgi:VanZ family protein
MRLLLLAWLAGILLPVAWLAGQWPPAARIFYKLTESEWVHVVMHLLLYLVLSLVLSGLSPLKPGSQKAFLILALILMIGMLQESIQVILQGRFLGPGEAFDFLIDLGGGLLGYGIWHLLQQNHPAQ